MSIFKNIFNKGESLESNDSPNNWGKLTSIEQLDDIEKKSEEVLIGIFKHSTRCAISKTVLKRFEKKIAEKSVVSMVYLDLLNYREVSNEIERRYKITHQSPQFLLIDKSKVIFNASHDSILSLNLDNLLKNC